MHRQATPQPGLMVGDPGHRYARQASVTEARKVASRFTKPEPCRRPRTPNPRVLLWADELPEQQSSHHGPVGDGAEVWSARARPVVFDQGGSLPAVARTTANRPSRSPVDTLGVTSERRKCTSRCPVEEASAGR